MGQATNSHYYFALGAGGDDFGGLGGIDGGGVGQSEAALKAFPATLPLFGDWLALTKPRIAFLALVMSAIGFVAGAGAGGAASGELFAWMLLGTGLVGAGACALNQCLEREVDAKMHRTSNRPLPQGRVALSHAVVFGVVLSILGELVLLIWVNPLTAVLGAITLLFYLAIYTPSKLFSSTSTLIGAVPGALPPLMGWSAATNSVGGIGFLLFLILFVWQIPHFLAIAWLYREDYARAGIPVLTVADEQGGVVTKQIILYASLLIPLTLVPVAWEMASWVYGISALLLGGLFALFSFQLALRPSREIARRLFLYSLLYLPLLGGALLMDQKS